MTMLNKNHSLHLPIKILLAGLLISLFELLRNQILLLPIWEQHYQSLGLTFHTSPVNGIIWLVWSFGLASLISFLNRHFTLKQTIILTWLFAFIMMWLTLFNLQVLPIKILWLAIPMSLLEVFLAAKITRQ